MTIQLSQRTSTSDNGLKSGIGSLSAYRVRLTLLYHLKFHLPKCIYLKVHVQEHATHKANRFARVKAAAVRICALLVHAICFVSIELVVL